VESYSLSQKASRGIVWIILTMFTTRTIQFLSAIVITRILNPEDFGVLAFALSIIAIIQGTTELGFQAALIQKQENPDTFLNVAWSMEFAKGVGIFSLLYICAPIIGFIIDDSRSTTVLRYMALSLLINSCKNVGIIYFKKTLNFSKQFIYESIPILIYAIVVISLSIIRRDIMSVVYAYIITNISSVVLSYILHPHRPKFDYNRKKIKQLFSFGKWIFMSSLLVLVREQGILLYVGNSLGTTNLGAFNRGNSFTKQIMKPLSETVWKLGFPLFSKLTKNSKVLKNSVIDTFTLITTIGLPLAICGAGLSPAFVNIFLTDKWLLITPLMKLMSIEMLFIYLATPGNVVFQAIGKPKISTLLSLVSGIVVLLLLIPLTTKYGLNGVALAITIGTLVVSPANIYYLCVELNISIKSIIYATWIPLISSIVLTIYIQYIEISEIKTIISFLLTLISCGIVYSLIIFITDYLTGWHISGIIKKRIASI
jgi:O-antigen/teichoic acid export membrane protein